MRPLDFLGRIKIKLGLVIVLAVVTAFGVNELGLGADLPGNLRIAIAVVLAVIMVQFLARGMTKPLREMAAAAQTIAKGRYGLRVSATSRDEVGELARAFNAMAADLGEVDRQRRELVANVSHELRTPITGLQAVLENVVDGVSPPDRETLGTALAQTQRLGRLVAQLLDLSRLDSGARLIEAEPFDLGSLCGQAAREAGLATDTVTVRSDVTAGLHLKADPALLAQVLANLLDNAVRHSPPGGTVRLQGRGAGSGVQLTVHDEGPGIPASERTRVFERFSRLDAGRAADAGGAGLGLAIAKEIVELHQGTIRVIDHPRGCHMLVQLPGRIHMSGIPADPEAPPAEKTELTITQPVVTPADIPIATRPALPPSSARTTSTPSAQTAPSSSARTAPTASAQTAPPAGRTESSALNEPILTSPLAGSALVRSASTVPAGRTESSALNEPMLAGPLAGSAESAGPALAASTAPAGRTESSALNEPITTRPSIDSVESPGPAHESDSEAADVVSPGVSSGESLETPPVVAAMPTPRQSPAGPPYGPGGPPYGWPPPGGPYYPRPPDGPRSSSSGRAGLGAGIGMLAGFILGMFVVILASDVLGEVTGAALLLAFSGGGAVAGAAIGSSSGRQAYPNAAQFVHQPWGPPPSGIVHPTRATEVADPVEGDASAETKKEESEEAPSTDHAPADARATPSPHAPSEGDNSARTGRLPEESPHGEGVGSGYGPPSGGVSPVYNPSGGGVPPVHNPSGGGAPPIHNPSAGGAAHVHNAPGGGVPPVRYPSYPSGGGAAPVYGPPGGPPPVYVPPPIFPRPDLPDTPPWVLPAAAGVGVVAAVLLPYAPKGLGLVLTAVVMGLAVLPAARRRVTLWSVGFAVLAYALVGVTLVRDAEWVLQPVLVAGVFVASLALSGSGRGWFSTIRGGLSVGLAVFPMPWFLSAPMKSFMKRRRLLPILVSLGVTALLLVIFGLLFMAADAVFSQFARDLLEAPGWADTLPYRIFLFVVFGVVVAAAVLVALRPVAETEIPLPRVPIARTLWVIPLAGLNLLFAAFVAVQITVLFGGNDRVLETAGLTYAEYARSGFFELVTVSFIVLGIVALCWALLDPATHRWLLAGLLGLLCAFTLVILASALHRLDLYLDAYGLTRLRATVGVTIWWLAAVFILVLAAGAVRLNRRSTTWLPRTFVLLTGVTLLTFALWNPDARIVETQHAVRGVDRLDHNYLSSLGVEAVPALDRLPEPIRSCVLDRIVRVHALDRPDPWNGWNWARTQARTTLTAHPVLPNPQCPDISTRSYIPSPD
ncbi:hypothetical protein GCM10009555_050390 [Acrocarpospora macrocephala]|uniref:Signal transduction histidine-protein kinase/phosphatase MprB n=1 Tax=Acrocarpospora macrocephala TaxID=150177 RepID=A0A5M3X547_9ACTN|nr:DUF4153 domain-containing protein [Acrocarpospora macrocephala]GES16190.1 hypothetical protein Amac_097880 [Acrocarpospora macrocephala]